MPATTLLRLFITCPANVTVLKGNVLITNAALDMSSNRVKFTPEALLWQRDRVALTDLQVGAQISVAAEIALLEPQPYPPQSALILCQCALHITGGERSLLPDDDVVQKIGYKIQLIQSGNIPTDTKPFRGV